MVCSVAWFVHELDHLVSGPNDIILPTHLAVVVEGEMIISFILARCYNIALAEPHCITNLHHS